MSDVTRLIDAAAAGDRRAAADLLPLVYDELRKLAAARLAEERPGLTLDATGLVHEAYLRLQGPDPLRGPGWSGRGHFFAAAAEAMRRILVEAARRRVAWKRGGRSVRQPLDDLVAGPVADDHLLAVHDAVEELARSDPEAAMLVKLRFFAGMTTAEAADALGVSVRSAHDLWAYARSWLRSRLGT